MKYLKLLFLCLVIVLNFPTNVFAADPTLSIRPSGGKVKLNSKFVVDILIDTKGVETSLARAAITYDPELLQVVKAERNSSLFCSYPEAEQKIDNNVGGVVITGFCQSGSGSPYKTTGEADVFARVTFSAIKAGKAELNWNFSGEDQPNMSVIVKDGSPPQNILLDSPKDVTFEIVKTVTNVKPPAIVPTTGIGISSGFVILGLLLVISGFVYVKWSDASYKKKLRTVILYGDKK